MAGYPERFAQLALGHNSQAVHRAYARKAQVTLPPLEDYERNTAISRDYSPLLGCRWLGGIQPNHGPLHEIYPFTSSPPPKTAN